MRKGEVEWYLKREAAAGLSRPARAVYRVLLVCARSDTGALRFERIGDKRFREETGYGRTSVKAARRELIEAGLLEVLEVGDGRVRSVYTVVLASRQLEQLAVAAGAENLSEGPGKPVESDPVGVNLRPPGGQILTPLTRAHPSLSGFIRPYPPGQGPWTGEAAGLRPPEDLLAVAFGVGATKCPVAVSRGKPCASCRACGTNPRAQRRAAQERRGQVLAELLATPPRDPVVNERGLAMVRAALGSKVKPGQEQGRGDPPDRGQACAGAP